MRIAGRSLFVMIVLALLVIVGCSGQKVEKPGPKPQYGGVYHRPLE